MGVFKGIILTSIFYPLFFFSFLYILFSMGSLHLSNLLIICLSFYVYCIYTNGICSYQCS